jgi:hypothetical protein
VSATLHIECDPPGADVEVDGSFIGDAPSDVQVAEGAHYTGQPLIDNYDVYQNLMD